MCARHNPRNRPDCSYHQGELKKGYDSDSSGHTAALYTPYQWSDLLNPVPPPIGFDAVLSGVLRSAAEMEKIKGLDEQDFQSVVDVLGQVSTPLGSAFTVFYLPTPCPLVREDRGCDEWAPEEMLQVPVQDMRGPRNLANTVHFEIQRFTAVGSPGLRRGVRHGMEREVQRKDSRDQEVVAEYPTTGENKGGLSSG